MARMLEKVTAFVVREVAGEPQLLLFQHPTAGIQIPAGTVEADEQPAAAALREAQEETGLAGLVIAQALGAADDPLPDGHQVMAATAPVHARPVVDSVAHARLRRGLPVAVLRSINGFTQVAYQEYDRVPDAQYVSLNITGWVADEALADRRLRHFFILTYQGECAECWQVYTDHHWFTLFWAPMAQLPSIIAPQDRWLAQLRPLYPQVAWAEG